VYLQRKFAVAPTYIRVLEFQKNGNPHFHILIDRYIPQPWLRVAWVAIGGGSIVDIRFVDIHRVSRYLSKYLTKELLLSAPLRSRRVTTSRRIHLLEKIVRETTWIFLRISIFEAEGIYAEDVLERSFDEDGVLESFTVMAKG
jgi:hypothetical protein